MDIIRISSVRRTLKGKWKFLEGAGRAFFKEDVSNSMSRCVEVCVLRLHASHIYFFPCFSLEEILS